jgi:hypothetical protein
VTECELFEPETLSSVGSQEAELSNISPDSNRNIMLNISIPQNTVETNEPNELVCFFTMSCYILFGNKELHTFEISVCKIET